jgi:hypothetical protein
MYQTAPHSKVLLVNIVRFSPLIPDAVDSVWYQSSLPGLDSLIATSKPTPDSSLNQLIGVMENEAAEDVLGIPIVKDDGF